MWSAGWRTEEIVKIDWVYFAAKIVKIEWIQCVSRFRVQDSFVNHLLLWHAFKQELHNGKKFFLFLFFMYYFSHITFNPDPKLHVLLRYFFHVDSTFRNCWQNQVSQKYLALCFLISKTNSEHVQSLIPNPHYTFPVKHIETAYPLTHLLIDSSITLHGRSPQDHILISIFLQTETQINGSGWFTVDTVGAVKKQNTLIRWEWAWELKKPPRLSRRTRALIINEKMGVIAATAMNRHQCIYDVIYHVIYGWDMLVCL